jgi:nucleotide-binding universal stress UspA family protein
MSRRAACHLVALLDHDEPGMWSVVDRAIELAEAKRAPLTLAATAGQGRIAAWLAPLALLSRATPVADADLRVRAGDQLAHAAEFVPASIPLTTVQLAADGAGAVRELAQSGSYDLLVIGHRLITSSRRIRRELRRTGLSVLIACPSAVTDPDRSRSRTRGQPVG